MKPRHVIYTVLATMLIFAAGVITGCEVVRKTSLKPPAAQPQQVAQMWRLDQFHRMVDQMNLDRDQEERVRRLIRERQEYIAEIMRLIEPDLPGVFIKLRRDINQELSPEQQRRLDEMWTRFERQKKFPNRNMEVMGAPGESPMNRMNQPFPQENRRPGPGFNSPRPGPPPRERLPLGDRQTPSNPPPQPPE